MFIKFVHIDWLFFVKFLLLWNLGKIYLVHFFKFWNLPYIIWEISKFQKSELGKFTPNFLLKHVITSIKLFSFSRKSILDVQVLWSHKMPKHETRNTFYWITWKVNTVCRWNLASLCYITKEKSLWKNSTKTASRKLVPGIFVFAKN